MLFDLQGKRKNFIRVIYAGLALPEPLQASRPLGAVTIALADRRRPLANIPR